MISWFRRCLHKQYIPVVRWGVFGAFLLLLISACDEAPLLDDTAGVALRSPNGYAPIEGSPFGVILNANVNLESSNSFLIPIRADTLELLESAAVPISNLAADIAIDAVNQQVYVSDREADGIAVFDYTTSATTVGLSPASLSASPSDREAPEPHIFRVDDEPTGILVHRGCTLQDRLLLVLSRREGTLSFVNLDTLTQADLNQKNDLLGLDLKAGNQNDDARNLGTGASLITAVPGSPHVLVSSSRNNYIFVVDTCEKQVELVIDATALGITGGRNIVMTDNQTAYWAHQGVRSIIQFDLPQNIDNGIAGEIELINIKALFNLNGQPERVQLNPDFSELWVSMFSQHQVVVLDRLSGSKKAQITVSGRGPGNIAVQADKWFALNFLSDDISVIDPLTYMETNVIR